MQGDFAFLTGFAANSLNNRLLDIKRNFSSSLYIGQGEMKNSNRLGNITHCDYGRRADIEADEEFLPFAEKSFDACISNLTLHSVNDLPGALSQIYHSLKPDGLFLASVFGSSTLAELRSCLRQAENEIYGYTKPHIIPFADIKQLGALTQRAGFAMPVADSDMITVTYKSIFDLFRDLRGMGESNIHTDRNRFFSSRALFENTARLYKEKYSEKGGRLSATFEVIYLAGWRPS